MGFDRVMEGQGFGIALTGMVVVFVGLLLVILFITYLPRALERASRVGQRQSPRLQPAAARAAGGSTSLGMDPTCSRPSAACCRPSTSGSCSRPPAHHHA
jgi:Na+-transporting methylmalonyl-CoA/oxaloacetate decarboxylase gamma subunit